MRRKTRTSFLVELLLFLSSLGTVVSLLRGAPTWMSALLSFVAVVLSILRCRGL